MPISSPRFVSPSPLARRLARQIAALGAGLLGASIASAVDFYKAPNETNLHLPASWQDSAGNASTTAPVNGTGPTEVCIWDARVAGALADADSDGIHEVTVGSTNDLGILTFRILNPAFPIVFNGAARTFTTNNGGGVDMAQATQNLTFENLNYRFGAANATAVLNVNAGRTLTYGTGAKVTLRSGATNTTLNVNTDGVSTGTVIFTDTIAATNMTIGGGLVRFDSPTGNPRSNTPTTTVNGGTLLVNNTSNSATGSGVVAVNSGATLGGAGTISGSVTAATGATLTPGNNGVGLLAVGSLTLQPGSVFVWEGVSPANADRVNVSTTNGLVINGTTATDDSDANHPIIRLYNPGTTTPFANTGVFTLMGYSGSPGGSGINALRIDPATKIPGLTYTFGASNGLLTLEISDSVVTPIDWAVNTSGNWSTGANWTGGVAPDAVKAIARIPGATSLTAPIAVTLDTARTVGKFYLESAQAVTLTGSSTLTLDQGAGSALLFASGGNHQIGAPLALSASGLTATVNDAGQTLAVSGVISGGSANLGKDGAGTLLLTADNTYTGTTSVSAGTLSIGNGGTTGSVAGPIDVTGTVTFNRSNATTRAFAISGIGNVEFNGSGTVTLPIANTYSGSTKIGAAGSVILAHADALKNTTLDYASSGGTLTIADPVTTLNLGALAGGRAFPLTNSIGTPIALNVGSNGASTIYTGSPIGTGASLTKNGSGTLTLTGVHAYAGATTVNSGTLSLEPGSSLTSTTATIPTTVTNTSTKISVSGGTLTASASSLISNASSGLVVSAGTANFNGGLTNETNNSGGNPFVTVTGTPETHGTLNTSSLTLNRGGLSIANEPTSGQTGNGLYINGGVVNIAGALTLGPSTNSSVSGRIDAGSLTVGGPITVGIVNAVPVVNGVEVSNTRWSVFDVNGGTVTCSDTATGVLLSGNTNGHVLAVSNVLMLVRKSGAVVDVPRIQFGQGSIPGASVLELSAGSLFVGSGGLVWGSSAPTGATPDAFNPVIRLKGGTLGATGDWSSTIPVSIQGAPAIVTGSSAANAPHVMTLHGATSGLGSLTKTGSGTVLFTSPSGNFQGPTLVESGTLGLSGKTADALTVNAGARFIALGTFQSEYSSIDVQGTLAIGYSVAGSTATVGRIETLDGLSSINLGASSTLELSGSGAIPAGTYVIAKAPVINGSFAPANVNLPAGVTLDQAYDDDANPSTPAVIAIVVTNMATPYDTWAASYSLAGANAQTTADPDADGMNNLLEYALDTDPTLGDTASAYTVARNGSNRLTLTFDHAGDSSLTYVIEATNDLTASPWPDSTTLPAFTAEGTYTHTDTADLSTNPRRFLRLKVTKAP